MLPGARRGVLTSAACLVLSLIGACSVDNRGNPTAPEFGTISGHIVGDIELPLAGVNVRLERSGSPVRTTTTGAAGAFTFTNVEVGSWALIYDVPLGYMLPQGLNQRTVLVTANQHTLVPTLTLNESPRIVVYNDGQLGKPGEKLPLPYWVAVFGSKSSLNSSVQIQWAVTSGGGTLEPVQDVAQLQGMLHVLGPSLGTQTVTATATTIPGAPTWTFTTTAVNGIVDVLGCTNTTDYCRGVEATAFIPSIVEIAPGQTVGWRWTTEFMHNVVFEDDPTEPASSAAKDDGSHIRRFDQPITVRYRCTFHSTSFNEGMVGTVIVK